MLGKATIGDKVTIGDIVEFKNIKLGTIDQGIVVKQNSHILFSVLKVRTNSIREIKVYEQMFVVSSLILKKKDCLEEFSIEELLTHDCYEMRLIGKKKFEEQNSLS